MKISSYASFLLVPFAVACSAGQPTADTAADTPTAATPVATQPEQADQPRWSVRMADSDMKRNPEGWMIDFNKKPKWDYTQGLFASALERVWKHTGDQKYFDYIKQFADTMIDEKGTIMTYKKKDYNIDRVNPGKFLIGLYQTTGEQKYKIAIDELRDQMRTHPRTKEGGFWHKSIYPHQMWLDGLYMGSPFLTQYAVAFNEPAIFDDVANQIHLIDKYTWDPSLGLYLHGWDESREQKWANPQTGKSPHVWGRAMGWFAMSLVDVLDDFPKDHPKRKEIEGIANRMAEAVVKTQDPETGLWWQVMDQPGRKGNYLESSASSMFTYFLVKGAKKGYIDQKYMAAAQKGYNGIVKNFIQEEADGTISITQVCSVAGLGGNPYRDGSYEYYISEPKRNNDPKAVGPFIMASVEFEELGKTAVVK